ncbi:MAG TPA: ribosome small subunit-dependent GTPase A, partial [Rudaea sp.]|nr:ribosome small subunit-dependent GTPase A [Rudaea sp.]
MSLSAHQRQRLQTVGWHEDTQTGELAPGKIVARVTAQHRNGYRVHDGDTEFNAQPAPRFLRRKADPAERPAVGDFVVIAPGNPALIENVLCRRTILRRAAAGERHAAQTIATNIDTVFVLMGLDGDFNPRRVERYLLLIEGSGAGAVVVLTKCDKVDDADESLARLRAAMPAIEIHVVNAKDANSVAPLLTHLQRGDSAVLVGSSGAGKSTLTNTLLGEQRQTTSTVRDSDSRGRHTTTHRALIQLPGGGCLIDTPGMRELKLVGDEDLGETSFADIETLALECRFGDCVHGNEPGCAVKAAVESGALDEDRWHAYLKLRDELILASD